MYIDRKKKKKTSKILKEASPTAKTEALLFPQISQADAKHFFHTESSSAIKTEHPIMSTQNISE